MNTEELRANCEALNILIWKVPKIEGTEESGEWWATELQDKDISIEWDSSLEKFKPQSQNQRTVSRGGKSVASNANSNSEGGVNEKLQILGKS